MRTALVLSAGGMYGAYQAGAWKSLCGIFQPDLVVGASIGAVNGWAIAGGCSPEWLIDRWLSLDQAQRYRWQVPRHWSGGVLNSKPLQHVIQEMYGAFQPKTKVALVVTDLRKLRPRVFLTEEITWQHLVASTAVIGIFDPVRIEGRIYSDGGLLSALPVWAAAELGATRILAVNALPEAPGLVARTVVRAMKMMSSFRPVVPEAVEVLTVVPRKLLGSPAESIYWTRGNAERWVRQGEEDALPAMRRLQEWDNTKDISLKNCLERKI